MLGIENKINPIPQGYAEAMELAKKTHEESEKVRLKQELEIAKREALKQVEEAGERIDEEPPTIQTSQETLITPLSLNGNQDEIQIDDDDE